MQSTRAAVGQPISLGDVLTTEELRRRPARAPDYAAENRALVGLAQGMVNSPRELLQSLVEVALELCSAGSAGISIIEDSGGQQVFRWHALAGELASHLWGTTPRNFSPCGTVVDLNAVQLMALPERHFQYFAEIKPQIVEALLVPFTVDGQTIGTVWVVTHSEHHRFDAEDERLICDLGKFAAAACQLRSALEGTKEVDRRKDEFLATVAHELRSPLAAVRTASQYLRARLRDLPDPQLRAISDVGQRQLDSMSRMIDDLLDMARIRLGKIELRKELVPVEAFVEYGLEIGRPSIDAGRHKLTVVLPHKPLCVVGDPLRLTQIVGNLLTNAAKYTADGGHIELSAEQCDGELVLRVRDSGIGISELMLPRIFNLYEQADAARQHARGGLGIGLALVRQLVQLHGGAIEARSEGEGTGSEFCVRLPLADNSRELVDLNQTRELKLQGSSRPLRILVVDDNTDSADILALLLRAQGHDVRTAYDGPTAVETSRTFAPEVTLQDIGMPGMNGFDVARKLRALPETQDAILIALTGYGGDQDVKNALSAGFDHHLVKPIDFDTLHILLDGVTRSPTARSGERQPECEVPPVLQAPRGPRRRDKTGRVH